MRMQPMQKRLGEVYQPHVGQMLIGWKVGGAGKVGQRKSNEKHSVKPQGSC